MVNFVDEFDEAFEDPDNHFAACEDCEWSGTVGDLGVTADYSEACPKCGSDNVWWDDSE